MTASRRSARPRRARIALTPLIDVVFILVVFFMLASTLDQRRALAVSIAGGGDEAGPARLMIEIAPDGLRANGRALGEADLARLIAAQPAGPVFLRPLAGSDVQATVAAMEALDAAGADTVRLVPAP